MVREKENEAVWKTASLKESGYTRTVNPGSRSLGPNALASPGLLRSDDSLDCIRSCFRELFSALASALQDWCIFQCLFVLMRRAISHQRNIISSLSLQLFSTLLIMRGHTLHPFRKAVSLSASPIPFLLPPRQEESSGATADTPVCDALQDVLSLH